ncbi:hypothetical protein V6N12_063424 [Hibiscus sabdariffa]|uniref:Uncharacterized protein n=2 Tax=Hibiscus sabdariffa TaxID=183260 RepID=A0ABR2FBP2_9ROSI
MKLGETEELRDTSIPKPLLPDYQRLLSSLPSRRLNTSKLIDNSEIFQNKLVDTIFPLLTSALEYGSAAAPALNALLKTGSRLSVEEFYLKVLPTIVKLFASNDRAIRVALLQHIVQYGEPLSAQVVDDQAGGSVSNREIVGLRTKKQQLTCNREMRQTGMKKPQFTFVMKILFILTSREKKLPTRELYLMEGSENYNLSRDLKSFLFHATDKNLAYVSPRFLLGSQSFVMDASERSKFIVNLEFVLIVVQGLSGMVRQAKVHGNACLESVVVMRTLDRKLHAFDVLSEYDGAKWNCYRTIAVNLLFVKTAIVSRKREELNRLRPEEPNTSSG